MVTASAIAIDTKVVTALVIMIETKMATVLLITMNQGGDDGGMTFYLINSFQTLTTILNDAYWTGA